MSDAPHHQGGAATLPPPPAPANATGRRPASAMQRVRVARGIEARRWRVSVAGGAGAKFASFAGQSFWMSAFVEPIGASLGVTRGSLLIAYSVATLLSAVFATALGRLADARGLRAAWAVAGTGVVLGAIGMSLSTTLVASATMLAVARACGQGGMPLLGTLSIIRTLPEPRGVAMSFSNASLTAAAVVTPPLALLGISVIGWRATLVGGALLAGASIVVGYRCWRACDRADTRAAVDAVAVRECDDTHDELQATARDERAPAAAPAATAPQALAADAAAARPRLGSRGAALLVLLSLAPLTVTATVLSVTAYAGEVGLGASHVAIALPAMALVGLGGAFTAGLLADRRGLRSAFMLLAAAVTAGPVLLSLMQPWAFHLGYIMLGVAGGVNGVVGSLAWARTFGEEAIGRFQGIGAAGGIVGAAAGPMLMALLEGAGHGLGGAAVALAMLGMVGMALAITWPARAHERVVR